MQRNTTRMRSKAGINVSLLLSLLGWLTLVPSFAADEAGLGTYTPLFTEIGIGHPPPHASSPTQARAMAERGAFLDAIRRLARRSGRPAPLDYRGPVIVGTVVREFRVQKIVQHPDGTVEVEVALTAQPPTP